MNLIDGAAAAYAAVAAGWGARRGVAEEGSRLLRLVISILAGCGLFALVNQAVGAVLASTLGGAGGLGFAVGLGVAFIATRKLKSALVSFLRRQLAEKYNRLGGAVAGLLRALAVVAALIACLRLSPWIPGAKSLLGGSLLGQVAGIIAPRDQAAPPPTPSSRESSDLP